MPSTASTSKIGGEVVRPGERGAQRLGDAAELDPFALGKGADRLLGRLGGPGLDRSRGLPRQLAEQTAGFGREQRRGLVVEGERAVGKDEPGAVHQLDQRLGSLLQPRHGGEQLRAQLRRQLGGELGSAGDVREHALDLGQEIGIGRLAHVVAVEALELGEVEARRRASDLRQVERRDHLLGRKDFLVAMAPAEPHQIVAHGRRQIAHRPIGIDAERAVALG